MPKINGITKDKPCKKTFLNFLLSSLYKNLNINMAKIPNK